MMVSNQAISIKHTRAVIYAVSKALYGLITNAGEAEQMACSYLLFLNV